MPDVVRYENPSLADIPEMLRRLAADIENSCATTEKGEVFDPEGVIVVAVRGVGHWPEVFGYGDCGEPVVELEAAKQKLFYMAFPPERL